MFAGTRIRDTRTVPDSNSCLCKCSLILYYLFHCITKTVIQSNTIDEHLAFTSYYYNHQSSQQKWHGWQDCGRYREVTRWGKRWYGTLYTRKRHWLTE